jgi:hypothetical protein
MSSNGVGSSGSGNDVKGSGEETMDNSAANNSGEGNSDESNSNSKLATGGAGEPAHAFVHPSREPESPTQSINAVREKKLIDKKRKRMNMRREYEEKVQQEMESSGGSDENASMKPGRPITLDKVLSLTKRARYVNAYLADVTMDMHPETNNVLVDLSNQNCGQRISSLSCRTHQCCILPFVWH